jgi:transcription regulator MmyB-like protein
MMRVLSLSEISGELLVKSPDFARLWERYDVRGHSHGRKTFHHPDVGDLALGYQGMQLTGTPGQHLITYYAEQGTAEYDALVLLDHLGAEQVAPIPPGKITANPAAAPIVQDRQIRTRPL